MEKNYKNILTALKFYIPIKYWNLNDWETIIKREEEVEEKPKTTRGRTTRGRTSTRRTTSRRTTARSHSHTRTPRRKIDSDIIGGIDFE